MFYEESAFDAELYGADGQSMLVDLVLSTPIVSGSAAYVEINIPLEKAPKTSFKHPCRLEARFNAFKISIEGIAISSFPIGRTSRKVGRGKAEIHHIGQMTFLHEDCKNEETSLELMLSPVKFFDQFAGMDIVRYGSTPEYSRDLFRFNAPGLGEVIFKKQWAFKRTEEGRVSAKVHSGYYASLDCADGLGDVQERIKRFRDILTILSLMFRQAVFLLGWTIRRPTSTEVTWIEPISPPSAPYNQPDHSFFVATPQEFEEKAGEAIGAYISGPAAIKKAVREICVAAAPFRELDTASRFMGMFAAFEQVLGKIKVLADEKESLAGTTGALTGLLEDLRASVEAGTLEGKEVLAQRLQGLIEKVANPTPSFKVKLDALRREYPMLAYISRDLWPIDGTDKAPGLYQLRNKIAHSGRFAVNMSSLFMAAWHFSILSERLVFTLLKLNIPQGITANHFFLTREDWYRAEVWGPQQLVSFKK